MGRRPAGPAAKTCRATWYITVDGMAFRLSSTDFGHLGIFP